MVTPLGEEKLIGRVRQPLRGVGRYAGTERAGQGAVVAYEPAAITVATAGSMRKLDANDKPVDERGGFVHTPRRSKPMPITRP